jgi:hypothetical protein
MLLNRSVNDGEDDAGAGGTLGTDPVVAVGLESNKLS